MTAALFEAVPSSPAQAAPKKEPNSLPALPSPPVSKPAPRVEPTGDLSNPPGGAAGEVKRRPKADQQAEDVAARTTDSQTFVNSDGTKTVRLFDRPRYFKQGRDLVEIDTRVVADPANPGTFRSAANSWSVSFAPLGAGGVRVVTAKGTLGFSPEGTGAVAPVVGTGAEASTVTYPEVWPGADLRYRVEADRLKEDIVIRRPGVAATYAFSVEGASLEAKPGAPPGALVPDGALGAEVSLAPPEVQAEDGRPRDLARPTQVAAPAPGGSRVVVGVDPAWLAGLAPSEYPVSVDPTVIVGAGAADWRSWKSDGYSCGPGVCAARVGNSRSSNYDTYYRSTIRFSYEAYLNQGARALRANLHLNRVGGTANGQWTAAYWADNWGYNQGRPCTWDGQFCGSGTTVWDVGDLDVTELYDFWLSYNLSGGSIFMQGAEDPWAYTFKDYAAYLDLTLDRPAPTATHTAPANASVVQTLTPTLGINPVYDPDGDGVNTWFRLSTSPDGESGQVFNTGWRLGATSATIPQGVLADGRTYYWRVYTWDGSVCCNVSAPQSFRVDRRLGADATQPFDQVGPASVNLASGNLVVATSGPSMKAVGGGAGVSFAYNSQAAPVQGLTGRYSNDANRNGLSDDGEAFAIRTDPQLSFNWGEGAPVEGMGTDWWTASWSGYLTAPVTGTYFFGATHDDGVTVRVNNQVVYAGGCCTSAYGGAVALSGGQAVPIQVDYNEVTNPAYLTFLVKGAVPEQAVPASWLTTAAPTLPTGWSLSAGDDVGWQWAKRGPQGSSVVLVGGARRSHRGDLGVPLDGLGLRSPAGRGRGDDRQRRRHPHPSRGRRAGVPVQRRRFLGPGLDGCRRPQARRALLHLERYSTQAALHHRPRVHQGHHPGLRGRSLPGHSPARLRRPGPSRAALPGLLLGRHRHQAVVRRRPPGTHRRPRW